MPDKKIAFAGKQLVLFLIALFLSIPRYVRAETAPTKTDLISDMQKSFNPREEDKNIQRIKQLQDVTGQEWLELSLKDRMDHMMAALYVLNAQGVAPRKTLNDYCNAVERTLVLHSDLYETQLTDILVSVIYKKEPASRPVLDKFMNERKNKGE